MQIFNIIEKLNGVITNIISYPIFSVENTDTVVGIVEERYKNIIREVKGIVEDTDAFAEEPTVLDKYVEDGYYTDNDGWELLLSWSDEVPMVVQGFALVD